MESTGSTRQPRDPLLRRFGAQETANPSRNSSP